MGIRAHVRPAQQHYSEQSCSNLFVAAPVVARLNSNGQMSLLTRTGRSVYFLMSLSSLNNLPVHRTTSAIVSMPLLAGGRKKRTFIGTIVILNHRKKSMRKRSVRSRRQRQRHSPSRCLSRSSFILPLDIHSHTHTQWVWAIKERIILEYTRHGHKCDTHNSLNTGG